MKICLLGNGLSSLVLAKILSKKNINVDNFIKQKKRYFAKFRTVGISKSNVEFLEKFYPNISKLGNPIYEIKVYDERNINSQIINFNYQKSIKFYIFKYKELYNFLKNKLKNEKKIKKISYKNNYNFYSKEIKKKYDLIFDTDLNSIYSIKHFSSKIEKNYNSNAYITFINHKTVNNNIARQVFTKFGPIAFLPLNESTTSIVFSIKSSGKKLNDKNLKELIKKYNFYYQNIKFKSFESFKLSFSIMRKYRKENILAFGEKLHKIHPLAGQGFNMSIRDIIILVEIIDKKINLGLPIDKFVFEEFEKKVKYKNTLFSSGIDIIYELFLLQNKIPEVISKNLFKILNKNKIFNKYSELIANKGFNF